MHLLVSAASAIAGAEVWVVEKRNERIGVLISPQDHTPTVATVAAVRAAPGNKSLPPKRAGTWTAVTGFGVDSNMIYKHKKRGD